MNPFNQIKDKNPSNYLQILEKYKETPKVNHIKVIYQALEAMEDFKADKQLNSYKSLINLMPKNKYAAENVLQAELMHFPRHQQCVIDVLQQMEDNGIMPDKELGSIIVKIFGKQSYALSKYLRMIYWMSKVKDASPWKLPEVMPENQVELAKIALKRITDVDEETQLTQHNLDEGFWIISAQSPQQKQLLNKFKGVVNVDGPFKVHLKLNVVKYFILKGDNNEKRKNSVHEQEDGIIFGICVTNNPCRKTLLKWIQLVGKPEDHVTILATLNNNKS
ncbi:evolutionarily conserved signaling intermediate in Toll pathway, mitochondrial [Aethina tumida]|uniref:evolutionarily conserved signaling intermediate in Toll pathway, mitochondrial n=1 Tax=Aethina tumida TaxID=116153 RepID=UPI002147754C|nr:evolutionarily conserved signaling intermediate in Toll pathway, mitochondrial [Aethina tumida]